MLQSNSFVSDPEKYICIINKSCKYLSKFGVFNMPSGSLGAWIKLNNVVRIRVEAIDKANAECRKENPETKLEMIEGKVCSP